MGVYLNPGNRLFAEAVQSEIYVDKTEMIRCTNKMLGTLQKYVCVSRPRRFGKSMTAHMLAAYYGKNCDSAKLFAGYKIAGEPSYEKFLNKYPVIALNMQSFFSLMPSVDDVLQYLQKRVIRELRGVYPDFVDEEEIFLSIALEDIYSGTGETFVFIIDEWTVFCATNLIRKMITENIWILSGTC